MSVHIDNFETIFGAKTNIQALRNKVLDLAIRGKLVEQDLNDEPASDLIKKIQVERDKLVKEGKIGKQKSLKPIEEDEIPFDIPQNWEWSRLGDIGQILGGGTPKSQISGYWTEGNIPWITPADLSNNINKYISSGRRDITELGLKESSAILMPEGTVLFSSRAPIGHIAISSNEISTNQGFKSIIPHIVSMNLYIYYFMKWDTPRINESASGTTFKEVSGSIVSKILIPIPPFAEQHRIVTKIESLMSEIDKLEEFLQKKEHLMELLPKAVVEAIGSCKTGEELKEQLQFVIENFETVFQTPESMQELRNVVLQLAIEGKLVPQDIDDEPASELIKKIKVEKNKLLKDGKIKKQKPLKPVMEDEIPFEIPENWRFVRLEEICSVITKGSSPKWQGISYTEKEEVLFITSENIGNNKLLMNKRKYVENKFNEIEPRSILNRNDILMNIVGASIGRTAIYNLDEVANINQAVCLIRVLYNQINLEYLLRFFNSRACINYMFDIQVDNARANLSMGNISKFLIPIPPISEQNRIVTKVESIMTLIDEMEVELKYKDELVKKLAV